MLSAVSSQAATRTPDLAIGSRASHRSAVCIALIGSALIHSTVMEEHLSEWLMAGFFFLALVAVETALALAVIYAWGRRTAQAVVVTGLVTVAVWLISRTMGLPVGPADFRVPEPVGVPDLTSCLLELGAAALVWRAAAGPGPHTTAPGAGATAHADRWLRLVLVTVAIVITGVGLRPVVARGDTDATHTHDGDAVTMPHHHFEGSA